MKTIKICLVLMIIMPTIYFLVTKFLETSKLHNILDVFSVPHMKVSSLPALFHDIIHPRLPVHSIFNNSYSPNTVFYVWCGKRQFEFQHYLSVLSVAYYLRPDNILFRGPDCIIDKIGPWTEVDWSGSWTAVDQSEALYRGLWSITCLCSPNWLSPGKPGR